MTVRPLRPATDRRLGEPLPHQPANRTRAPPDATRRPFPLPDYAVLALLSESYSPHQGRYPTRYSPVCHFTRSPKRTFSFDLHVLGTPPALILSQDQTLSLYLGSSLQAVSFLPYLSKISSDTPASAAFVARSYRHRFATTCI